MTTSAFAIRSSDDLDVYLNERGTGTVVLLVTSEKCQNCPPAKQAVEQLGLKYNFESICVDITTVDEDLYERFSVTRLPAILIFREEKAVGRFEACSPELAAEAVALYAPPKLRLDADF